MRSGAGRRRDEHKAIRPMLTSRVIIVVVSRRRLRL